MYKYKKYLYFFVFAIMLLLFLYYFVEKNSFDFSKIKDMTIDCFLSLSFLIIITLMLLGLKTKLIASHFNIKLSKTEWIGLGVINTFWNYLFLKGGVVARAVYLKKKGFPYSDFSSMIIVTHIISLILFSFLLSVIFIFVSFYFHISLFKIIMFFLIIFVVMILLLKGSIKTKNKILQTFIKNKRDVEQNKLLITKLVVLELVIIIVYSLRLKIVGDFFDYNLPLAIYFLMAIFSNISMNVLNLVPGGLGIKEAGSGLILKLTNFKPEFGIIITLVDRMIAVLWILPLGMLFSFVLFRTVNYKEIKKQKS